MKVGSRWEGVIKSSPACTGGEQREEIGVGPSLKVPASVEEATLPRHTFVRRSLSLGSCLTEGCLASENMSPVGREFRNRPTE